MALFLLRGTVSYYIYITKCGQDYYYNTNHSQTSFIFICTVSSCKLQLTEILVVATYVGITSGHACFPLPFLHPFAFSKTLQ